MSIVSFLNKVDATILNPLLEVLFAVAFLYFLWAIIQLIQAGATDKAKARNAVLWSLVGMFIMISVYGVINVVLNTFQISTPSYIGSKLGQ